MSVVVASTRFFSSCVIDCRKPDLLLVRCRDSKPSRGFSRQPPNKDDKAPALGSRSGGKPSTNNALDTQFEERLEAVRRSTYEQRKSTENKKYGAIDYDAPIKSEEKGVGFGTKVGVGFAIGVFGLVFSLGDFLPSERKSPSEESTVLNSTLSKEERISLQARLQELEATLTGTPRDSAALEGAAVTLAELGEYSRAASVLEDLTKAKPSDSDVLRLLGEVKYELKDFVGSAAAYRSSAAASNTINFEVLRGLTNALLAAKKPDEAVQILVASRKTLSSEKSNTKIMLDGTLTESNLQVDPVQVELLLGKAYSDWGHISDAVSVYDELISSHPSDFRGYLAKGIILKENGSAGDAERMFIQARFFAPENAKALVDLYSRR